MSDKKSTKDEEVVEDKKEFTSTSNLKDALEEVPLPKKVQIIERSVQLPKGVEAKNLQAKVSYSEQLPFEPLTIIFFEGPPKTLFKDDFVFKDNCSAFKDNGDYVHSLKIGNTCLLKHSNNKISIDNLVLADSLPLVKWEEKNTVDNLHLSPGDHEVYRKWVTSVVSALKPRNIFFAGKLAHYIGMGCFFDRSKDKEVEAILDNGRRKIQLIIFICHLVIMKFIVNGSPLL
eukprot:TRINITY_DN4166_c0_g1_i2.p1 TRINITY_DN4166_c0_g1~~TRINITY_DN4166_c0_g1_i2.p1  ORF type:complete len:231 (-),score=16.62 TRINITY_DN4166_c0_g1_i2:197-889(-)